MDAGKPIRLMAIQAANEKGGFYLAWIPAELDEGQIAAALAELGIEAEQTIEVGGWRTSSSSVAVAFVPFPPTPLGLELLEPSRS